MATKYIPPEHSLIRYVPFGRLRRDADDNVLGVLSAAFQLRENEKFLSATWLDYFAGNRDQRISLSVNTIRNSNLGVKPKSGFAIGITNSICETCESHPGRYRLRVIHEEEPDNVAHVAVRGWPRDQDDLLVLIADDVWNEIVLNKDVP